MENITAEGLLRLGAKEWLKPGSDEVRYYINADKLLELADDYDVTNTMSNAEELVFSHNKWWFTESMHLKTSLSFKDTKHKYLMSSVPKLVQDLLEEI
jgi:hypothetical protein